MEWYICACIENNKNKPIILHLGLAHSDKIIKWLQNLYNYIILSSQGINYMNEINNNIQGCIQLPEYIDKQFGGYKLNKFKINF
jgi:hypothetical protein